MQGECGICACWTVELGLCPVCLDFVCIDCWALGKRRCVVCAHYDEADTKEVAPS